MHATSIHHAYYHDYLLDADRQSFLAMDHIVYDSLHGVTVCLRLCSVAVAVRWGIPASATHMSHSDFQSACIAGTELQQ